MVGTEAKIVSVWPLVLYFALVIAVAVTMIGFSHILGERHNDHATGDPYESGIASLGSARLRISAKFYLVALFFVIFDLEAVFIFAWAVALYDVGWAGYIEMLTFISVLLATLVYLWRIGALNWSSNRPSREVRHERRLA